MKDKKHKIDYFSENLAVPEIHVDSADEASDNDIDDNDSGDEMMFDNLAILSPYPLLSLKGSEKCLATKRAKLVFSVCISSPS